MGANNSIHDGVDVSFIYFSIPNFYKIAYFFSLKARNSIFLHNVDGLGNTAIIAFEKDLSL